MKNLIILILFIAFLAFGVWYLLIREPGEPMFESPINNNNATTTSQENNMSMQLTSSVFTAGKLMPPRYTCDGDRTLNPPLTIQDVPQGTTALTLIMEDPDVPTELRADGIFDHWVLYNIPSDTRTIGEGEAPGTLGANTAGTNAYTGPCPPVEYEPSTHRYIFTLYALDIELPLQEGATKEEVLAAMQGHILEQDVLIGTYHRVE